MASRLSQSQIDGIRRAFDNFDRNKDGSISTSELGQFLEKFGRRLDDDRLRQKMEKMDLNGNGRVEFKEFLEEVADFFVEPLTEEEIRNAFKVFDVDKSGKISFEELKRVATAYKFDADNVQLQEMLRSADSDSDRQISLEEFVGFLKQ